VRRPLDNTVLVAPAIAEAGVLRVVAKGFFYLWRWSGNCLDIAQCGIYNPRRADGIYRQRVRRFLCRRVACPSLEPMVSGLLCCDD